LVIATPLLKATEKILFMMNIKILLEGLKVYGFSLILKKEDQFQFLKRLKKNGPFSQKNLSVEISRKK